MLHFRFQVVRAFAEFRAFLAIRKESCAHNPSSNKSGFHFDREVRPRKILDPHFPEWVLEPDKHRKLLGL